MTKSHKQKACGIRVPFARPGFQAHLQPFGQTGVNSDMFLKHTPSKECFGDGPSLDSTNDDRSLLKRGLLTFHKL